MGVCNPQRYFMHKAHTNQRCFRHVAWPRCIVPAPLLWAALFALLTPLVTGRTARADATTYSTNRREFKVGILLIDSTADANLDGNIDDGERARGPENPDPFVFYIADARTDVKPQNWELVNPLAPPTVTADVKARWDARMGGVDRSGYAPGQKVTKNMAAYWEVSLSKASVTELLQYDLLFITNHRVTAFSPQEREKLRKLVDAGGVVWIEDCGNMRNHPLRPFFLDQLQFSGGTFNQQEAGTPAVLVPDHPILNTPYQLTFQEIANIGDKNYGNFALKSFAPTATSPADAPIDSPPNPEVLINIVGNSAVSSPTTGPLPYIAAGSYGSGAVIATAGDSGCDINDYAGGTNAGSGGNSGSFSGPNIITAHVEDLKFLYNLVAWGGSNAAFRGDNRRTAASFQSVGAPLIKSFNFDKALRATDVVNSASAPLIVKNTVFVAGKVKGTNTNTLRCYDQNPYADRDGDGNFDDGRPDVSLGLPFDEIWRYDAGGTGGDEQPSTPTYGSVYNAVTGSRLDKIFVTMPDGSLLITAAFPRNGAGVLQGDPTGYPGFNTIPAATTGTTYDVVATRGVAPAPVYNENKIYQVQPNGMLRCIDASSGAILWTTFQTAPTGFTLQPTGTPTLGFSRQASNTGFARASIESTNDLMLYVPMQKTDSNGTQGIVYPYLIGTRNEVQIGLPNTPDGSNGIAITRIGGGQGGPQPGQYTVAQAAPYLVPHVRVFARDDEDTSIPVADRRSAREMYALGIPSPGYSVTATPQINPDGKVQITRNNMSYPTPRPQGDGPDKPLDLLIAVDYDIVYVDGGTTEPANYASTQDSIGSRPYRSLQVPSYDQNAGEGNLTTPAYSPEDLVLFAVQRQFRSPSGTPDPRAVMASMFAVNEQEGDAGNSTSRTFWHFGATNGFTATDAPYDTLVSRDVDGQQVTDVVPLRNFLIFDPAWPLTSSATTNKVGGRPTGEALRNIRMIGSPIVTNDGTTYAMAAGDSTLNNRRMTVLMAYKTNPDISITLPEAFNDQTGVTVTQANLLSDPNNPSFTTLTGPQLLLDGARGRITIINSRGGGGQGVFNAAQSCVVRFTSANAPTEKRYVAAPTDTAQSSTYGQSVDDQGNIQGGPVRGGYTPLLWYYCVPGDPTSSPTLIGNYLYYTAATNAGTYLFAVDGNPSERDPAVRVGLSEPIQNVVETLDGRTDLKINHVAMRQPLSANGAFGPPVGSGGLLAVNTLNGTNAFSTGITLIADVNRLVEADPSAAAAWTLDSTVNRSTAGGDLPIYGPAGNVLNPPATGRISISRDSLVKPQVARRLNSSDYLIADTGNNRVVRTDRGGNITWSLANIADPYGIFASGDPASLNGPTDVQFYAQPTITGGAISGYETHYIVADANNYRIIEVADFYDTNGKTVDAPGTTNTAGQHILVWTTRTSADGRRLRYTGITRFLGVDPTNTGFGYPYLTAVIGNTQVAAETGQQDFTGGSIVSLGYTPFNTPITLRSDTGTVIAGYPQTPWTGLPARQNEPARNGAVVGSLDRVYTELGAVKTPRRIGAPTFYQRLSVPAVGYPAGVGGRTLYLVCDAEGAYVIEQQADGSGKILWYFTQADYNRMNGVSPGGSYTDPTTGNTVNDPAVGTVLANARLSFSGVNAGQVLGEPAYRALPPFLPTSLQLLPSGNYLISNSASRRSELFESGQFVGEAFEVNPNGLSVLTPAAFGDTKRGGTFGDFAVPRVVRGTNDTTQLGQRAISRLNRQVMGNPENNTGLVEQPYSASRP